MLIIFLYKNYFMLKRHHFHKVEGNQKYLLSNIF